MSHLTKPERIELNRQVAQFKRAFLRTRFPIGRVSRYGDYYNAVVGVLVERVFYTSPGGSKTTIRSAKQSPEFSERHTWIDRERIEIRILLKTGGFWFVPDKKSRDPILDWVSLWVMGYPDFVLGYSYPNFAQAILDKAGSEGRSRRSGNGNTRASPNQ